MLWILPAYLRLDWNWIFNVYADGTVIFEKCKEVMKMGMQKKKIIIFGSYLKIIIMNYS